MKKINTLKLIAINLAVWFVALVIVLTLILCVTYRSVDASYFLFFVSMIPAFSAIVLAIGHRCAHCGENHFLTPDKTETSRNSYFIFPHHLGIVPRYFMNKPYYCACCGEELDFKKQCKKSRKHDT